MGRSGIMVEVEVDCLEELREYLEEGAEVLH